MAEVAPVVVVGAGVATVVVEAVLAVVVLAGVVLAVVVNPRRACAARITVLGLCVCVSVCLSVCYHVFCRYAQRDGQKAIPTGSVPHWLYFKMAILIKMLRSKVMA